MIPHRIIDEILFFVQFVIGQMKKYTIKCDNGQIEKTREGEVFEHSHSTRFLICTSLTLC